MFLFSTTATRNRSTGGIGGVAPTALTELKLGAELEVPELPQLEQIAQRHGKSTAQVGKSRSMD